SEIAQENPDQININEVVDKLIGDVEGEKDDQPDDNYEEEITSDSNVPDSNVPNSNVQTGQGQQRQSLERPHRVIIPTWKVIENQLDADELPESTTTTVDLIMLNLTNAVEQLQAPQSYSQILKRQDKD